MIRHYLKIAFRNLWKYRTQSIISILGLAVGFACLSLSVLWIHYENSYDAFHKDYKQIYALKGDWGNSLIAPGGIYAELRDKSPEVEAIVCYRYTDQLMVNDKKVRCLNIDSTFTQIFSFHLLKGNMDFMKDGEYVALSSTFARELFGKANPIGQEITISYKKVKVGAVVESYDEHSILAFDVLEGNYQMNYNRGSWYPFFVKLRKGADVPAFEKKIDAYSEWDNETNHLTIIPITQTHRKGGGKEMLLSYSHLHIFCLASTLLVLCALTNFLVLYLIRLKGRSREMALRLVNGATGGRLLGMFLTELLMVLVVAFLLGMLLIEWTQPGFSVLSGVKQTGYFIMRQGVVYMGAILGICLLVGVLPINLVRRRALQSSLVGKSGRRNTFRWVSTFVQLTVSLGFIFCTAVMMKQIHFLKTTDWGFNLEGRALLTLNIPFDHNNESEFNASRKRMDEVKALLAQRLKEKPSITEVLAEGNDFGSNSYSINGITLYSNETATKEEGTRGDCFRGIYDIGNPLYGFRVVEGVLPREDNWANNQLVITENVRRKLGLENAVGKTVYWDKGDTKKEPCVVVAVIKDIYYATVTGVPQPFVFRNKEVMGIRSNDYLPFGFLPKQKKQMEKEVAAVMSEFPDVHAEIKYTQDIHNEMIKSENNLMKLLLILSVVSVLVAIFGVYSIVTLACNQRRKEIALRKVNGATVRDILKIFVKEYGLLLVASSVVAFSVGTYIMHDWILQYSQRTPLSWWVYAAIFVLTALVIVLCVGYRVWHTANENPAVVIKSE